MTAKQKANRERFKKVVAEAKKLRKKNPKLTQAQAVKQAWAIQISKENRNPINRVKKYIDEAKEGIRRGYYGTEYKKKRKKVGATSTKVKAKKRNRTSEMHTDTKSHNVNIRVMSGVDPYKQMQFVLNDIKFLSGRISEYQKVIDSISKKSPSKRDKFEKKAISDARIRIKNLKKALIETKKNIKF